MRVINLSGILLSILLSTHLQAQTQQFSSGEEQVTLVELFTSEGCSSCPPAEAWLNRFVDNAGLWQRIIPMAFHVDYWDYIGWKDRFARPRFSKRQYRYQEEGGIRTVYTPGVLVNGREWRGWYSGAPPHSSTRSGSLTLSLEGDRVSARFAPATGGVPARSLRLHLVLLAFGLESEVAAGENRGRRLAHEFVVVGMNSADSAEPRWHLALPEVHETGARRYALVAWVSETRHQRPLQAVGGWLSGLP